MTFPIFLFSLFLFPFLCFSFGVAGGAAAREETPANLVTVGLARLDGSGPPRAWRRAFAPEGHAALGGRAAAAQRRKK